MSVTPTEYIELTIQPIPPDTVSSVRAELLPTIEAALHEAGQEQLLTEGQIQVEVEQTFPTDQAIVVGLTLGLRWRRTWGGHSAECLPLCARL